MRFKAMKTLKLGKWLVAALLLVGLSVILATRSSAWLAKTSPHPTDAQLEENLRNHELEFSKLIAMSKSDSRVTRIAPDFTWLDDNSRWPRSDSELGFSRERWNEYRQLFKILGLKGGINRPLDVETVYLIASSRGLLTSGSEKGYAYSELNLLPTTDSLDHIPSRLANERFVYKKIQEHWYLYLYGN